MAREKKKTRNEEDRDIGGYGAREKERVEEERRRYRSQRRARERLHRVRRIEIATCYIIKSDILIIILV